MKKNITFTEPEWGIYYIVCFICGILLHLYSLKVYDGDYARAPLTYVILFVPSALSAYYLGDNPRGRENLVFSFLYRIAGIIITVWPTAILILLSKFIFSLFL
jgi:hypothetical protein